MSKEEGFINSIFIYEKIDSNNKDYLDVDIDVSKLKYELSRITREDGHLHLRIKRKESPSPSGLTHNVRVNKSRNPEFFSKEEKS